MREEVGEEEEGGEEEGREEEGREEEGREEMTEDGRRRRWIVGGYIF